MTNNKNWFSSNLELFFSRKNNCIFHLLIIIALTVLVYSNSFTTEFQLDDNHIILNNEKIKSFDEFKDFSSWQKPFFNRKIPKLTFAINYYLHEYELFGYHLVNLIVHILNVVLVYWFIILLFQTNEIRKLQIAKYNYATAFFVSLIFAVHPVQTEAVTYITQRMVSIASFFYLLALCLYLKGRFAQIDGNKKFSAYFIVTFISFLFGVYSKAIIFSFPLTLIILEIFFLRNKKNKISFRTLLILSSIILFAILLILFRYGIPNPSGTPSTDIYILTELRVLVTYLRLLFLPINLHLFYYYPLSESIFEWNTFLSFLLLVFLFITGIKTFKKYRFISFSIFLFFITLAVESSFIPLKYVIFEYRLYLTVIAFGIFLASILLHLPNVNTNVKLMFLIVVSLLLATLTYSRNKDWQTGISIWKDNVAKAPLNPIVYNHLGTNYFVKKDYENALINFNKAILLDSNYAVPYNHRGVIYKIKGDYKKAINNFHISLKLDSTNSLTYNNMGFAYQDFGVPDSAIIYYKKAIELFPKYHTAYNNLATVLQVKNKFSEALVAVNKAIELNKSRAKYYNNRGNIYFNTNKLDLAKTDYEKSIRLLPKYDKALNNLGLVFIKEKNYNKAINLFTKAITYSSNYADPYLNRGYALFKIGGNDLALIDLKKCLIIDSDNKGAAFLINKIIKLNSVK